MRTYLVSYDLAKPHLTKHVVAQAIMSLGSSWARPLENTWYVRSEESEETLEAWLSRYLEAEDGLLIQPVKEEAVMTNTSLRWFRQRRAGIDVAEHTNVIAFPVIAPLATERADEPELPFATAC
ncbi:MAG: hypothetical protein MUC37_03775 [Hyphomicrobium sp.]|jgi:hypothetical protein|nr:hypothetical protein [Hyphomicrobium sp.]